MTPEALWLWPSAWARAIPMIPGLSPTALSASLGSERMKFLRLQEGEGASLSGSIDGTDLCLFCAQLPSCSTGSTDSNP